MRGIRVNPVDVDCLEEHIESEDIVLICSDVLLGFKIDDSKKKETLEKKYRQRNLLYTIIKGDLPFYFATTDATAQRTLSFLHSKIKNKDKRYQFHNWEKIATRNKYTKYSRLYTGALSGDFFYDYEPNMPEIWRAIADLTKEQRGKTHHHEIKSLISRRVDMYVALQLFENCRKRLDIYILSDSRKISAAVEGLQQYVEYCQERQGFTNNLEIINSEEFLDMLK